MVSTAVKGRSRVSDFTVKDGGYYATARQVLVVCIAH